MTLREYQRARKFLLDTADAVETAKRPDYTIEHEDVLINFKRVADRAGITPEQALLTYALKHEDAISRIMRNPMASFSEPPILRFADRLNYLSLGLALLVERGTVQLPEESQQMDLPFGDR